MQEKSAIGTRQTSVHLNGEVTAVDFGHDYKYYAVRNDGTASIYVSTENSECTVGANGVVCVPAGGGYTHYNGYGGSKKIYLSGNGAVTVIAQDDAACPFKSAAGGGDANAKYIDGVPVDLTGMYNTQVIGYDEASSKLVPMITYAKTQTIFPSTASPKVYEVVDQINITRIIELGNGIRAYSSSENESDPAIFAIRFGPIRRR